MGKYKRKNQQSGLNLSRRTLMLTGVGTLTGISLYKLHQFLDPFNRALNDPSKRQQALDSIVESVVANELSGENIFEYVTVKYDHDGSLSRRLWRESDGNYMRDPRTIQVAVKSALNDPAYKGWTPEAIEKDVTRKYQDPKLIEESLQAAVSRKMATVSDTIADTINPNEYEKGKKSTIVFHPSAFSQFYPGLDRVIPGIPFPTKLPPSEKIIRSALLHELGHAKKHFYEKLPDESVNMDILGFAEEIEMYSNQLSQTFKYGNRDPGYLVAVNSFGVYMYRLRRDQPYLLQPNNFSGLDRKILMDTFSKIGQIKDNFQETNFVTPWLNIQMR